MSANEKDEVLGKIPTVELIREMLTRRDFVLGIRDASSQLIQSVQDMPGNLRWAYGELARAADSIDAFSLRLHIENKQQSADKKVKPVPPPPPPVPPINT